MLLRTPPELVVAGRTDRGVHARGQVVSFSGGPVSLRSLNALLPPDMAALAIEEAPEGFSARHDAVSRTYRYRILARAAPSPFERDRAWWWPHRLDPEALHACAALLPGTHDFTAFTPAETYHVRFTRDVMAARWEEEGEGVLAFVIEADTFMRQMNRVLVGTMIEVASGRRTPESFAALLRGAPREEGGRTAPPHGLCLESVRYLPGLAPRPRL